MKYICQLSGQAQPRVPATALKFDETTIRQIARLNPRYAATLAEINRQGGLSGPVRLAWSAVELKPQDVEWWLKADKGSAAFFYPASGFHISDSEN